MTTEVLYVYTEKAQVDGVGTAGAPVSGDDVNEFRMNYLIAHEYVTPATTTSAPIASVETGAMASPAKPAVSKVKAS